MASELVLHTVPSSYLSGCRPLIVPYPRIVGMEFGEEAVWATTEGRPAKEYYYDPTDVTTEQLEMPASMAIRALCFFQRSQTRKKRFIEHIINDNCHSFGDYMEGNTSINALASRSKVETLVTTGAETEPPLAMGERGVLVSMHSSRKQKSPKLRIRHSFIGLGLDDPRCLQLMNLGGFMAIETYRRVLQLTCRDTGLSPSDLVLYKRQAIELPANALPDLIMATAG